MIEIQKNTMNRMKGEREKAAILLQKIRNSINRIKHQMKEIPMVTMIKVTNNTIIMIMIEKDPVLN
jgi:archaellum component FlaC